MSEAKEIIIHDVKKYIEELRKIGIPVQRAMLFGSWAKGIVREESDVDVALISSSFTGDRFEDRRKIIPLRRKVNSRIEPMPFTPKDFEMGGNLVDEIIRYGEEVI